MFAIERILELISLHLYVQSSTALLYNVDEVSLKKVCVCVCVCVCVEVCVCVCVGGGG